MNPHSSVLSSTIKQLIPASVAWKYRVIPQGMEGSELILWSDQGDAERISETLSVILGRAVRLIGAESIWIDEQLTRNYLRTEGSQSRSLNVDSENFIHEVIREANLLGCSDIHIEKYQERCRIRMRLDGKLVERYELKKEKYHEYVNKIKIISHLDIAEKRLPQDGRILIREKAFQYDIRVSVLPTLFGEKVVLRLLSSDASNLDIRDLGMGDEQLRLFMEAISRPQGMVLISGPTGSGKTTTLYGALKHLNQTTTNILTIEDPVEYTLEGINQVQLNEKVGLDFAATLRTFLRQDPDIIMVGEIRDVETAKIAIRAAMTGHLVMSTLHTNSALGIVTRLTEMGIPEYLIADTLNIAVAQRLLRKLCTHCKRQEHHTDGLPQVLRGMVKDGYYVPIGCPKCHGTGYRGRKAIYEMIAVTDTNRHALLHEPHVLEDQMDTLRKSATLVFLNGETSLEEIYTYLT